MELLLDLAQLGLFWFPLARFITTCSSSVILSTSLNILILAVADVKDYHLGCLITYYSNYFFLDPSSISPKLKLYSGFYRGLGPEISTFR